MFAKNCTTCKVRNICIGRCLLDPEMNPVKHFDNWNVNLVFLKTFKNQEYNPDFDKPYFYGKKVYQIVSNSAYADLRIYGHTAEALINKINAMTDLVVQQDTINAFYEFVDKYNKTLYNRYMDICLQRQVNYYLQNADDMSEIFAHMTPASQAKFFEVLSNLDEEELKTFLNDRGVTLPQKELIKYKEWKTIPCYPIKEYSDWGKPFYYKKEDLPGYVPEYKTLHCNQRGAMPAYDRKQLFTAVAEAVLLEQMLGDDVFETRKGLDNNEYTFKSIRQMDCEGYDRVFKETYMSNDYMSIFYGEGDSVDEDEAETEAYFSYPEEQEVESDEEFYNQFDDEEDNVEE